MDTMNIWLLALLGTFAMMVVSLICYGVLFKSMMESHQTGMTGQRLVTTVIGMYILSYAFIQLFNSVDLADVSQVIKGFELGLMAGIPFFALPLFIDAPRLQAKPNSEWLLIVNWVFCFVVLGLLVGSLS